MQILLAQPRSFCAGVVRAIDIVESALISYGPPVYVLHEIVHNQRVLDNLERKGAIFLEEIEDIPDGSIVIFSAHGVSREKELIAERKSLKVVDATCPLVSKVHKEVAIHAKNNREVIVVGHANHVEVQGTLGRYEGNKEKNIHVVECEEDVDNLSIENPQNLGYVTQTTLSIHDTKNIINALKKRFPKIKGPNKDDICYASHNRQNAVIEMANTIDLLLVVGAKNSSNSNRLREVGDNHNVKSFLIQHAGEIAEDWFSDDVKQIGITAGASTPNELVDEVINRLRTMGETNIVEMEYVSENVYFPLPDALKLNNEKEALNNN